MSSGSFHACARAIVAPFLVAGLAASPAFGAGDVAAPDPCDDFEDGVTAPYWQAVVSEPAVLTFAESEGRLGFVGADNPRGPDGIAGYFTRGWALDLSQDFHVAAPWRFAAEGSTAESDGAGLAFGAWATGSLERDQALDAAFIGVGIDVAGPSYSYEQLIDGGAAADVRIERTVVEGVFHLQYDAALDVLTVFSDDAGSPPAFVFEDFRLTSGSCRASIACFAFTNEGAPAFGTDDAWFDDLCILEGTILSRADLDCSGTVDFGDLLILLGEWGPCSETADPCVADIDGDADVSLADLLQILANWSS